MRLAFFAFAMALCFIGCAERHVSGIKARHISPADFAARYQNISSPGIMRATSYAGENDGKAYLRVGSMSTISRKWNDQWYYVQLAELESSFRASLPKKAFPIESK